MIITWLAEQAPETRQYVEIGLLLSSAKFKLEEWNGSHNAVYQIVDPNNRIVSSEAGSASTQPWSATIH